jgi:hypothetical protein
MGLPSFSIKFPKFHLPSSWRKSLYGDAETSIEVPHGQLSLHIHPHLNLNVGLSLEGIVSFDSPDWKLHVSPLHFHPSAPKLFSGEGLHLLRGDDGEIGVSFDKRSSRHFFFLGAALPSPKFSLKLQVFSIYFGFLFLYFYYNLLSKYANKSMLAYTNL